MRERLSSVVEDALEDRWESLPLLATYAGAKGWDHTLGEVSPDAIAGRLKAKKALLRRLTACVAADEGEALDKRVLAGQLEVQVAEIERYRRYEWDAALYPLHAVRAVHLLIERGLPKDYGREMAARRLAEYPRYLAQGLRNLSGADEGQCRLALDDCRTSAFFLREAFGEDFPGVRRAVRALEDYASGLRSKVLPKAGKRYPTGKALFDLKLKKEHGLSCDSDALAAIGRQCVLETTELLRRTALEIDPRKDWRRILREMKRSFPSGPRLLDVYKTQTRRSRSFCRKRDLVSFPKGERLRILPTPRFEWDTSPYAALLPPPVFGPSLESVFYVTPVDPSWPKSKQRERLQGHCRYGLPGVCPHEGYPGHHIQLARAKLIASKVRKVYSTPVLVEGWALYCEELMEELGYLRGPRERLYRLKDQLWRACRIVVDVGLHVEGWSPRRAADYLVRGALLEPPNAQAEVNRYRTSATQPMSYMMGKIEIMKLRERCRAAWGRRYSLKRFHDRLLDYGSMPPSWIPLPGPAAKRLPF